MPKNNFANFFFIDNQQPIKIWEPKSGAVLTTIHAHKSTVMDVRWNPINGNWLLTASRDHLIKVNFKVYTNVI